MLGTCLRLSLGGKYRNSLQWFFMINFQYTISVRFQVLMAASMEIAFCAIVLCGLVEVDQRFRGCTASIIRAMSKPHPKNPVKIQESVGPGGILAGPVGRCSIAFPSQIITPSPISLAKILPGPSDSFFST
jgi:hypothetical protein